MTRNSDKRCGQTVLALVAVLLATLLQPAAARAEPTESGPPRVAGIARRLLLASAPLCPERRSDFGLEVGPATLFSWGAPITTVWSDGPAAAAGLRAGDLIRAVNAVPWSADAVERALFETALAAAPHAPRVTLAVERDGLPRIVTLIGRPQCQAELRVSPQPFVNATAVDSTIVIGGGLERLLPDDAELAFAVAHEAAHIALGHTAPAQRGAIGARSQRLAMERDADALALRLMARAGYDPAAAARAWPKIADAGRTPLLRLMDIHGPYMGTVERTAFLTSEADRLGAAPTEPVRGLRRMR